MFALTDGFGFKGVQFTGLEAMRIIGLRKKRAMRHFSVLKWKVRPYNGIQAVEIMSYGNRGVSRRSKKIRRPILSKTPPNKLQGGTLQPDILGASRPSIAYRKWDFRVMGVSGAF